MRSRISFERNPLYSEEEQLPSCSYTTKTTSCENERNTATQSLIKTTQNNFLFKVVGAFPFSDKDTRLRWPDPNVCRIRRRPTKISNSQLFLYLIVVLFFLTSKFEFNNCQEMANIINNNNNNFLIRAYNNPGIGTAFMSRDASRLRRMVSAAGIFLNHQSYSQGEVLLFRTKKYRHRAIAVMNVPSYASSFKDALTFKEWLQRAYKQQKALKVSVRTTEVVRPVLQHLYASKRDFRAPIIIHANIFESSFKSKEKAVDPIIFIHSVQELLPNAVISVGWTPSLEPSTRNALDWPKAFRLLGYIHPLKQPIILNMKLNDASLSVGQLEWLLGTDRPSIFLIVRATLDDILDSDTGLKRLAALSRSEASRGKILFDVDPVWQRRLMEALPTNEKETKFEKKKEKRSVAKSLWQNVVLASPHSMLSTSIVSSSGVAFLGWPNSLLISEQSFGFYPTKQTLRGRLTFFAKRQSREIWPWRKSGVSIQLFESNDEWEAEDLDSTQIDRAIVIFIGYDGRVSIESSRLRLPNNDYHQSTSAQLPKSACYAFEVEDRGWRVETEVWSERCPDDGAEETNHSFYGPLAGSSIRDAESQTSTENYRVFLQLDTPITKNRKARKVAISKTGDGAIDFLFRELEHSAGNSTKFPATTTIILFASILITRLFVYLTHS